MGDADMKIKLCAFFLFIVYGTFSFANEEEEVVNKNISENKSFVIVIPSYNNEKWCEKNLLSVFSQNYENFRIIYIDDCSSDNTYQMVQSLIQENGQEHRTTLIRNSDRKKAMANIYHAVHLCKREEIVVLLDGDDWLSDENVLQILNDYYSQNDIWVTYGQFQYWPSGKIGFCQSFDHQIVKNTSYRKSAWTASHLRTFYAGIFQRIKLQDFFLDGDWLEMGWDLAIMFPILEMAGPHYQFIPDVLYVYNRETPLNDDKINVRKQVACNTKIRQKPKYSRLKESPYAPASEENTSTDIIVFSYDRPMQLYANLESICTYIKGIHQIFVIYRSSNGTFLQGYEEVIQAFPNVTFLRQEAIKDFKPLILQCLRQNASDVAKYVLFSVDDIIVKEEIDLPKCINALQQTQAYGFFFRLGLHVDYCYMMQKQQNIPFLHEIQKGIYAWLFTQGKYDWNYPNNVDMTLYCKKDIYPDLWRLKYDNPNILESLWQRNLSVAKVMGLCFASSKVVNIPLNLVNKSSNRYMKSYSTQVLLDKFLQGWKMDIQPFYKIKNSSAHIEKELSFISRDKNEIFMWKE